ncbi:hypothetical protein HQ403_01195 [Candidatus Kaiserbacteria bacterium]|nr:hypothetical protein [Candidatus Kaiserbacteria bacterium]
MKITNDTISWQGYEYTHHEKSSDWFWALGIVALSSAITAIIFKNILFALLLLIGAFTVALFAAKRPHLIHFEITRRGVTIDDALYPFSTLESFWIDEDEHGHHSLILKSQRLIMPYVVIPLDESVQFEDIRNILLIKLEEEEMQEPTSHKIFEFFGF